MHLSSVNPRFLLSLVLSDVTTGAETLCFVWPIALTTIFAESD